MSYTPSLTALRTEANASDTSFHNVDAVGLSREELDVTAEIVQWLSDAPLPDHLKIATVNAVQAVSEAELLQDTVAADEMVYRMGLQLQPIEAGAYTRIAGLVLRLRKAVRQWVMNRRMNRPL